MALSTVFMTLCALSSLFNATDVSASPAIVDSVVINGTCLSKDTLDAQREALTTNIKTLLKEFSASSDQESSTHCSCGDPNGQWTKVAHLNMSDPDQECPANWTLNTGRRLRGCDMSSDERDACDSAFFHMSNRQPYSHVCGRVIGYQRGSTDAFAASIDNSNNSLEGAYIDGISLTHGAEGSRQHIWSFVAANSEDAYNLNNYICPCTDTDSEWSHRIPQFIENNYFCDTGGSYCTPSHPNVVTEDPLWDGEGCGPFSSCCDFNNPPWFCTTLPQPTTDDIELRICSSKPNREATIVKLVDIYAG